MATSDSEPTGGQASSGSAVQSVDRALQILEIIASLGTAAVGEIAVRLEVHRSTVSRLLASLEQRNFVEQVSERGKYRLGIAFVRMSNSAAAHLDLTRLGQPICDALARAVGETANVAVLDGDRAVNVTEAAPASNVALRSWIGQSSPAYATSSGKVLLAYLDPDDVRQRLGGPLTPYTATTIVTPPDLAAELAEIRSQGWAIANEELEVGLLAIAYPVRDAFAKVVAAVCISGPSYRLSPEVRPTVREQVRRAADELSALLGYSAAA